MEFKPELLDSPGYREALAAMLAQFLLGEEISFTAVPMGLEFITNEDILRQIEEQLEDEKRHHKMFAAERVRLGLPTVEPVEAMHRFNDVVIDRMRKRDIIGGVISGCFMLEGAADADSVVTENPAVAGEHARHVFGHAPDIKPAHRVIDVFD